MILWRSFPESEYLKDVSISTESDRPFEPIYSNFSLIVPRPPPLKQNCKLILFDLKLIEYNASLPNKIDLYIIVHAPFLDKIYQTQHSNKV